MADGSSTRDYRGVDGAVDDADQSASTGPTKPKKSTPKSPSPTAEQAIQGETTGRDGERSFGTPINDSQQRAQNTDSNN
jgi:hypothetical protein